MAFDTFIKIQGIVGESTDVAHKQWIEVFSFSHGIAQEGAGSISSVGGRVQGKIDHQNFTVTKRLDSSSALLAYQCCSGKHYPTVEAELCKNTGNKEVFMKYKFEDVVVASTNIGGGQGQETPVETVSFQYGKIQWEYVPLDPKTGGKKGAPQIKHWSVLENKGG